MATVSHTEALEGGGPFAAAEDELDVHKRVAFNAHLRVLLCTQCSTGIRPGDGIVSHFRKVHRTTGRTLRDIVDLGLALEPLADPHDVQLPADGEEPMKGLQVQSGFQCTASRCGYRTISRQLIYAHGSQHRRSDNSGNSSDEQRDNGRQDRRAADAHRDNSTEGCDNGISSSSSSSSSKSWVEVQMQLYPAAGLPDIGLLDRTAGMRVAPAAKSS